LPYFKVWETRSKTRRLGLGLMGIHEWLISRGSKYEVTPELHQWLGVWKGESESTATSFAAELSVNRPWGVRAIAPTGTIGILAGTTTGIEPIFATAYKRRYLVGGSEWRYQYVIDSAAQEMIDKYGVDPESVESALDLAAEPERRVKFQADIQDYVDQSISSTINLPAWGTELNNQDSVETYVDLFARYAPRLRGMTVYADGSRGGQPLTSVPYEEAKKFEGETFVETHDICDISGSGGSCGI
jgi:ribonucleoside-diphosphate reductase alpha chain